MDIRNVSGRARTIPALGKDVDVDGVLTVSDEIGAELLLQPSNWAVARTKTAKTPEPTIAEPSAQEE